jgi:integrase
MNTVQPIRDKKKLEAMKQELLRQGYRDYLLFVLGINTGFRVSDLLELKVKDVKDVTHITVQEKKTKKIKRAYINSYLREQLDSYISTMNDDEYLFQSRKGSNNPISRVQAYRILNKAAERVGLEEIGTHTLRKTFGYHHYQLHKDVAILQELFNHSAPSVTLRYIGVNQDNMDKTLHDFCL